MRVLTVALCCLLTLVGAAPKPQAAGVPVFAVVVMRHGVRSVTHAPPQYRFLDWQPVAPGFLTAHGYRLVRNMGRFYRGYFGSLGLPLTCANGAMYVYADLDQRTLESARALIDGACGSPGAIPYAHDADTGAGTSDPIFDGADWLGPAGKIDASASVAAVRAVAPDPQALVTRHAAQFAALQTLLDPLCPGRCTPAASGAGTIVVKKSGLAELTGPVTAGSDYAESLFLQTAECAPAIDERKLEAAMALHVLEYDVNARNAYAPLVKGGNIFAHIVGLLDAHAGRADGDVTLPERARNARVVFFSGHDTQLGALGGILRAHWHPGGGVADDDMPPGSALIFTLLKMDGGGYRVEVRFATQTMAQFRSDRDLPGGVRVTTVMSAPLDYYAQIARGLVQRGFVRRAWTATSDAPVALAPLADPSWSDCSR